MKQKPLVEHIKGKTWVCIEGWTFSVPSKGVHRLKKNQAVSQASNGEIGSPMPGQVLKILVKKGDSIKAGQSLCVVEAMKMEHNLKSPFDGEIEDIHCETGQAVSLGDLLIKINKKDSE